LLVVPAVLVSAGTTSEVPAAMAAAYRGVVVFGQATLWSVIAGAHASFGVPATGTERTEALDSESGYPSD